MRPPAVAELPAAPRTRTSCGSSGSRRSSTRPGASSSGDRVPLVVSADRGQAGISLERDCEGPSDEQMVPSRKGSITIPFGNPPGLYHAVATRPGRRPFSRAGRGPLGRAARQAGAAHRARRLAVPDLARLQRLRRRPERDPGQLVPVLASAARLAEGAAPARRARGRPQGGAAVLALALLALRPHAADHRRRARPAAALDAAHATPRSSSPATAEYYEPATYDLLDALPRRRRQPRLPAGEPLLPAGAGRSASATPS